MRSVRTVPEQTLKELENIDTCAVSNAIEYFTVRTRNEGFVNGSVRCLFSDIAPKIGYAVTASVRTSSTPIAGKCYYDNTDWWSYVNKMPAPRFLAVRDVDHMPGVGALFGEIHAVIAAALGCVAYLTNGAVRDLPGIRDTGLQIFAGTVAVSHAYAHIVDFDEPVEIGGLQIKPGDLLHGDQHGVVRVPVFIASEIPRIASELLRSEKKLIEFCRSPDFSFDALMQKIRHTSQVTADVAEVQNDAARDSN